MKKILYTFDELTEAQKKLAMKKNAERGNRYSSFWDDLEKRFKAKQPSAEFNEYGLQTNSDTLKELYEKEKMGYIKEVNSPKNIERLLQKDGRTFLVTGEDIYNVQIYKLIKLIERAGG